MRPSVRLASGLVLFVGGCIALVDAPVHAHPAVWLAPLTGAIFLSSGLAPSSRTRALGRHVDSHSGVAP